ncbi:carboxypeptidase-like regulatory domain-containing protein [Silvibacterium sp.]|uniref:carboxypeptidase-like regulatory domain-containing protein n=1 Tax=Silvibacterium sp. TaxID=1964179 RepID=UPI0039E6CEC2
MRVPLFVSTFMFCASVVCASAQQVASPEPQGSTLVGTVADLRGDVIPEAAVSIDAGDEHYKVTASDTGFFSRAGLHAGVAYHVTVDAPGFKEWTSQEITLTPGQYFEVSGIRLYIAEAVTTVKASLDTTAIAEQQVKIEEQQKVLGFVPNFYTTYEKNPAPLTTKLKFQLALHTEYNPVTFLGVGFISAVDQAGDSSPHYQQGWLGYGQRFGANYANGFTDILFGGAVLPSLLHQDPRYYYQGEGSTKSRLVHSLTSAFICHGDNGKLEVNYSSMGGFLISGALAETYYPERDRGAGLVASTFGVNLAANMANGVIQEFILKRLTPSAKNHN